MGDFTNSNSKPPPIPAHLQRKSLPPKPPARLVNDFGHRFPDRDLYVDNLPSEGNGNGHQTFRHDILREVLTERGLFVLHSSKEGCDLLVTDLSQSRIVVRVWKNCFLKHDAMIQPVLQLRTPHLSPLVDAFPERLHKMKTDRIGEVVYRAVLDPDHLACVCFAPYIPQRLELLERFLRAVLRVETLAQRVEFHRPNAETLSSLDDVRSVMECVAKKPSTGNNQLSEF